MLHIMDLQICADVIASTLLDLTDPPPGHARNTLLTPLSLEYETWCKEQRPMACISKLGKRRLVVYIWEGCPSTTFSCFTVAPGFVVQFFQFGTDRLRNSIWITGISPTLHWQNPWPFNCVYIDLTKNLEGGGSPTIYLLAVWCSECSE